MDKRVVVYGAGGHGKVVAEVLTASGYAVMGFLDDDPVAIGTTNLEFPVFAVAEWLASHQEAEVALGIGDNHDRERGALRIKESGGSLITAVHPAAVISGTAKLAEGVVVMAGAVLNAECEIGKGAIVNSGAIVEHDVKVGSYAHLSPNCTTGGGAQIGSYTLVGMGASVLPLKKVGTDCTIGAGAVVVNDIPDNCVAFGVPAKIQPAK